MMSDSTISSNPRLRCEVCRSNPAIFYCTNESLSLCANCTQTRHKFGNLQSHKFTIIHNNPVNVMNSNIGSISNPLSMNRDCQICELLLSIARCPACDICFCQNCGDNFHSVGTGKIKAQLLAHKLKFEYLQDMNWSETTNNTTSNYQPTSNPTSAGPASPSRRTVNSFTFTSPPLSRRGSLHSPKAPQPNYTVSNAPLRRMSAGAASDGGQGSESELDESFDQMNIHDEPPPVLSRAHSTQETHSPEYNLRHISSTAANNNTTNPAVNITTSPTSQSSTQPVALNALSSPFRKISANQQTFKLIGYSLTYPSKQQPVDSNNEDNANYTITIDPHTATLNIQSIHPDSIYHSRHFTSIFQLNQDVMDNRKFSIQFKDSQPIAKCIAMQAAEAEIIFSLLNNYMNVIQTHQILLTETDILFSVKVLKKSKISYSNRWLVLKRFTLKVYKTSKFHVPSNIINLNTVKLKLKEENNLLTLETSEKPFIFKFVDNAERDTFVSLMQKAVEVKVIIPTQPTETSALNTNINSILNRNPATSINNNNNVEEDNNINQTQNLQTAEALNRSKSDISAVIDHNNSLASQQQQHPNSATATLPSSTIVTDDSVITTGTANCTAITSSFPPRQSFTTDSQDGEGRDEFDNQISLSLSSQHQKLTNKANRRTSRRSISRDFTRLIAGSKSHTSLLPTDSDSLQTNINNKIEFTELNTTNNPYSEAIKPNKLINVGVYEFMRKLYQSMQTGQAITNTLYAPKQIWYQSGVKILSFAEKLENFELLKQALRAWQTYSVHPFTDLDSLNTKLFEFRSFCEEIQNKLAQHLSYIHTVKSDSNNSNTENMSTVDKLKKSMKTLSKTVTRATAKASKDKIENTQNYIVTLKQVLELAQIFRIIQDSPLLAQAHYQTVISSNNNSSSSSSSVNPVNSSVAAEVQEHLLRIAEFFYAVVVNTIVRDMKTIMKRYIKHCTKTLSGSH